MPKRTTKVDRPSLPLEDELVAAWDAGEELQRLAERACSDWSNLDAAFFEDLHDAIALWKEIDFRTALNRARAAQLESMRAQTNANRIEPAQEGAP